MSPISSLLFLLGLFVVSFFLLIEIDLEFLALLLLLVYVGAVFVLFLFCIMMMSSSSVVDLRAKRSIFLLSERALSADFIHLEGRDLFFSTFSIFLFVFLGFDVGLLFFFDPFFIVPEAEVVIDYASSTLLVQDFGLLLYTVFFFVLGALAFVLLFGLISVLVIISPF
jgi:NADH:ubiquinone oxidoreductase subunit 6 (subunit J)